MRTSFLAAATILLSQSFVLGNPLVARQSETFRCGSGALSRALSARQAQVEPLCPPGQTCCGAIETGVCVTLRPGFACPV
ncbi:hypothetical protein VKT23_016542 [Stygiomarasmius scandens]|uniref:Hydrophobin n=1 Tax=Marasmiellus scandens TaxID=2682957 RepID=A0ABR1IWT8_9AGAR